MTRNAGWVVSKPWPIVNGTLSHEAVYNNKYFDEVGFHVGDKSTPLGIELCDILENRETALYHVKMKFSQSTRDLCSQIQNAAILLHDLRISHKNEYDIFRNTKIPKYATSLNLKVEELETFLGCSSARDLTFVMACQTHQNLTEYPEDTGNLYFDSKEGCNRTRSLKRDRDKAFVFSRSDLEVGLLALNRRPNSNSELLDNLEESEGLQGLDALLHLLVLHKFSYELNDNNFHVTSRLIYVENSDVFRCCIKKRMTDRRTKTICDEMRFLLSPWITDFISLLPKYCIIELSHYFDRGSFFLLSYKLAFDPTFISKMI